MGTSLRGIILVFLAAFSWGFSGALGQFLFQNYSLDAFAVTAVRVLLAGAIMISISLYKNKEKSLALFENKKNILTLIKFAIFGLLPGQLAFLMVVEYSNAGMGTLFQYSAVIFIMLYVCIIERKFPTSGELVALVLVLTGVFLLATRGDLGTLYLSPKVLFLGLLAALGSASTNILPRELIKKYEIKMILGSAMFFNGIGIAIYESTQNITGFIDIYAILAMVLIVLIGTVIGFDLYMQGLSLIGPSKASMLCSIEPVLAAILAAFWLDTVFTVTDIIGMTLILLAVMIISYNALKQERVAQEILRAKIVNNNQ